MAAVALTVAACGSPYTGASQGELSSTDTVVVATPPEVPGDSSMPSLVADTAPVLLPGGLPERSNLEPPGESVIVRVPGGSQATSRPSPQRPPARESIPPAAGAAGPDREPPRSALAPPPSTTLPDLTGYSPSEAARILEDLDLRVEVLDYDTVVVRPDAAPVRPGTVRRQNPAPGTRVMPGTPVELLVLRRVLVEQPMAMDNGGDGDRDGVPDDEDACPRTATAAAVIARGCSADQFDLFRVSLPDGTYAFNAPDTMIVERPHVVVLVLKPREAAALAGGEQEMRDAVLSELRRAGDPAPDTLRIEVRQQKFSSRMRAVLQGPQGSDAGDSAWRIRARAGFDETRLISASDSTVWVWDVVPMGCPGGAFRPTLNCGRQTLTLAVYAFFGENPIPWPLIQESIDVRITMGQKLAAMGTAGFPWAGLLLVPTFGFLWWVRRRRITILFLAANPHDTNRLNLDEEIRAIDAALQKAPARNRFRIEQHWAVRNTELDDFLLRHRPQIVHFSGHGSAASELILEDGSATRNVRRVSIQRSGQAVSSASLSRVFAPFKGTVRCVVLNACYSEAQARAIAEHVDCVVGMSSTIGDAAAINFAAGFYQALAYGEDVERAFELACSEIDRANLPDEDIPRIVGRAGGTAFVRRHT